MHVNFQYFVDYPITWKTTERSVLSFIYSKAPGVYASIIAVCTHETLAVLNLLERVVSNVVS